MTRTQSTFKKPPGGKALRKHPTFNRKVQGESVPQEESDGRLPDEYTNAPGSTATSDFSQHEVVCPDDLKHACETEPDRTGYQ
ncbi:hypothetical protein FRC10_007580, partial [Ceratobasidium sp. 414]